MVHRLGNKVFTLVGVGSFCGVSVLCVVCLVGQGVGSAGSALHQAQYDDAGSERASALKAYSLSSIDRRLLCGSSLGRAVNMIVAVCTTSWRARVIHVHDLLPSLLCVKPLVQYRW